MVNKRTILTKPVTMVANNPIPKDFAQVTGSK